MAVMVLFLENEEKMPPLVFDVWTLTQACQRINERGSVRDCCHRQLGRLNALVDPYKVPPLSNVELVQL